MKPIEALQKELRKIADLKGTVALMYWDMETYMPAGGAQARAHQVSMLESLVHERFTGDGISKPLGELIDLDTGISHSGLTDEAKRLSKEVWKNYHRAVALPKEFIEELTQTTSLAQPVWVEARKNNDFNSFAPLLKKIIALKHREIKYIGSENTPYDTLLDEYEPGVTTADINVLFSDLKEELVPMIRNIQESGVDTKQHILHQFYSADKQWNFSEIILKDMGYDFHYGRQDKAVHPFTIQFHPTDVRITTRINERNLLDCLTGSIHEGGHALYEQGMDQDWYGTPFCEAISYGIHESQSRLWENLIGLSKPFWEFYFPKLQNIFPDNLSNISLDEFYKAVNTIKPGLIRVDADEMTYNLHIMLRFEIEQMIFNDGINVSDLPQLWGEKMEEYLGIRPDTDTVGVLQDVHWSHGSFGYFPTYALGNLYNIIILNKAKDEIPNLDDEIRNGNLLVLRNWLRENVHRVGRKKTAMELIRDFSGENLSSRPFLDYIKEKYSTLYFL